MNPYPDENSWWNDPVTRDVTADYAEAGVPLDAGRFKWFARTGYDIAAGLPKEESWRKHRNEMRVALGLLPFDPPAVVRLLQGQPRVIGNSFGDASGPRQIRLCSWFPAIRIFKDNPDRFYRELDEIMRYWQGYRTFAAVGSDYWVGARRDVQPSWPNYDELAAGVLRASHERGLKVHLTTGDMQVLFPGGVNELVQRRQMSPQRAADMLLTAGLTFNQRLGVIVNSVDPTVIALREVWNEGWQNNYYGDDPDRAASLLRAFKGICPQPLGGLSAGPEGEEPDSVLRYCIAPATVSIVHGRRWGNAIERAFALARWMRRDGPSWPIWQGEPAGPDTAWSSDVYQPIQNPNTLFGIYMMHIMTGQATNYFNSPSIRYGDNEHLADGWGFKELPLLMNLLPEDIGQWPHIQHGNTTNKEAPWSARRFADAGSGPGRVDQVYTDGGGKSVVMVYEGSDPWEVYPVWNAQRYRIVSKDGVVAEGRVRQNQYLPGLSASQEVRLIIAERD